MNSNNISSFVIPVSDDPFDRNREFGIDHKELLITFKKEGKQFIFTHTCHKNTI